MKAFLSRLRAPLATAAFTTTTFARDVKGALWFLQLHGARGTKSQASESSALGLPSPTAGPAAAFRSLTTSGGYSDACDAFKS